MSALLSTALSWLSSRMAMILGAGAIALTAIFSIRQAGKQAEKIRNAQITLKAIGVRNNVEYQVNRLSDSSAISKLRSRWTRD